MKKPILTTLLVLCALALPIALAAHQRAQLRHLYAVRHGVLYRSAQLPPAGLQRAVRDLGIRTVVNLRDGVSDPDRAEEDFCKSNGLRFVRIPQTSWLGGQRVAPATAGLEQFLDLLREPANHPILIHCYRGVHRTGGYVAIYRMEVEGWSNEQAVAEMMACGYDEVHEHRDVLGFLQTYRPVGTKINYRDSR